MKKVIICVITILFLLLCLIFILELDFDKCNHQETVNELVLNLSQDNIIF